MASIRAQNFNKTAAALAQQQVDNPGSLNTLQFQQINNAGTANNLPGGSGGFDSNSMLNNRIGGGGDSSGIPNVGSSAPGKKIIEQVNEESSEKEQSSSSLALKMVSA